MASEGYGVFVGWRHEVVGGRVILKLETVRSLQQSEQQDVDTQHLMMTENQALVLGQYLFNIAGKTPPKRHKRGWWARLLG